MSDPQSISSSDGLVVKVPRWDQEALELVCGIANAGGGYLLVPSSHKSHLPGKRKMQRSFEAIPDTVFEQLGIQCAAAPMMDGAEFCLELEIPSTEVPLSLNGTYWLYTGNANTKQSYDYISRLWQDEQTAPWELKTLSYVEQDDLSHDALLSITGIPIGDISGETLTDTVNARIEHLGLSNPRTKKLVNAGALLLCTNPARFIPGASVHIIATDLNGTPTDKEDTVIGPLAVQIDKTVRLIMDDYLPEISTSKAFSKKSPPESAIREAVTNALIHKDYASGVPVRITISPRQLEIQNAGSLPPGWIEDDLMKGHAPSFRNPLTATTSRLLGIMGAWGEGTLQMRDDCISKGAEAPQYEISPNRTMVLFPLPASRKNPTQGSIAPKPASITPNANAQGSSYSRAQQTVPFSERSIAAAHKLDLTQTDEYVLKILTTNGRATAARIAGALDVSERTIRRSFKKLREYGFIERIGSDKAGFWSIIE